MSTIAVPAGLPGRTEMPATPGRASWACSQLWNAGASASVSATESDALNDDDDDDVESFSSDEYDPKKL